MSTEYKKLLDELVGIVAKEGGSDLHIAQGRSPMIRVAGFLIPLVKIPPLKEQDVYGLVDNLMTPENKQIFLSTKEIDFSYAHTDGSRFRGNGYYRQAMPAIALRLIPRKIKT